jgi:hypothetical protein
MFDYSPQGSRQLPRCDDLPWKKIIVTKMLVIPLFQQLRWALCILCYLHSHSTLGHSLVSRTVI